MVVTDNDLAADTVTQAITVNGTGNNPPAADFIYSASDLTVTFTDQSTDADGSIISWSWDFGDGATSTEQNPIHLYASAGIYTVTQIVTDNEEATDGVSKDVTVSIGGGITLTATVYKVRGLHKIDLEWSGASEDSIDIYRDGVYFDTTENDGFYTDNIDKRGGGFYRYKILDGSTWSNEITVSF